MHAEFQSSSAAGADVAAKLPTAAAQHQELHGRQLAVWSCQTPPPPTYLVAYINDLIQANS